MYFKFCAIFIFFLPFYLKYVCVFTPPVPDDAIIIDVSQDSAPTAGMQHRLYLVLAWFKSYVLRLVFLDSSLKSPGQEKDFGILFIPLRVLVCEIQLSVET